MVLVCTCVLFAFACLSALRSCGSVAAHVTRTENSNGGKYVYYTLTLDAQLQLIADSFALRIDGAARVVSAGLARNFLQHQTLIGAYDARGSVMRENDALSRAYNGRWNASRE